MRLEIFANLNFLTSLNKLIGQDMAVKTAYKLKDIRQTILSEFSKYDELRQDLVKQYADKDDTGNVIRNNDSDKSARFSGGNEKLFVNKIKELHQLEFKLPKKIKLSEIENLTLSTQDVLNLKDIVEE